MPSHFFFKRLISLILYVYTIYLPTGRWDVYYLLATISWSLKCSKQYLFILTILHCSPEGSAMSSISGSNPTTAQCPDQSASIATPKPPPGYGDDFNGNLAESLSNQQNTSTSSSVIGKWPLKPGVLVHSKQQLLKLQSTNNNSQSSNNIADNGSDPMEKIDPDENEKPNIENVKSKKINNTSKVKSVAESIVLNNETQSARTARIRRMMIGSNNNLLKKLSPMSPPPAPPLRENKDNTTSCSVEEKYPSVTGRQIRYYGYFFVWI